MTKATDYFEGQAAPLLPHGEAVGLGGYFRTPTARFLGADGTFLEGAAPGGYFLGLNASTLVLVRTRGPAFGPLLENKEAYVVPVDDLTVHFGRQMTLKLPGRTLVLELALTRREFPQQRELVTELARRFGGGLDLDQIESRAKPNPRALVWVATLLVLGVVLGAIFGS